MQEKTYPLGHSHIRLRRLRSSQTIRNLVSDTSVTKQDLIYPLFITYSEDPADTTISSMPGICRVPVSGVLKEIKELTELGLHSVMLFPVIDPALKSEDGHEAFHSKGLLPGVIHAIKQHFPSLCVMADVALDPYTTHGHDGILNDKNDVDNDATVDALCKQSLILAQSGVDFVCPSDMMDGRIGAIRAALDQNGFFHVGIIAYSAKFASGLYGPFRAAVQSGAASLDKRTYQLDYSDSRTAMREVEFDIKEGADMVIIKPALFYADVIARLKQQILVPILAYQVSGEYSMIKAAAAAGYLDEKRVVLESFYGLKRAGADVIITYFAKWACQQCLV